MVDAGKATKVDIARLDEQLYDPHLGHELVFLSSKPMWSALVTYLTLTCRGLLVSGEMATEWAAGGDSVSS